MHDPKILSFPRKLDLTSNAGDTPAELLEVSAAIQEVLDSVRRLTDKIAEGSFDEDTNTACFKQIKAIVAHTSSLYVILAGQFEGAESLVARIEMVIEELQKL